MLLVKDVLTNGENLAIIAASISLIASLAVCCRGYIQERRWQERFSRLIADLNSTSDSSIGIGKRLIEIDKKLEAVIQDKEEAQNGYTPYTRATEMLGRGEDIDNVINDCGISRAEAELMQLMHKQMKRCGPARW